jgi:hypothetical protein
MVFGKNFLFVFTTVLLTASAQAGTKSVQPPAGFEKPPAFGRAPGSTGSSLSYDINAGSGTYNNVSYSEINLGLNWMVADWLNWRNALFARLPSTGDSISGLDSSLRLQGQALSEGGTFGLSGFIGPGVRFASRDANAAFAEAGLMFKLGGISLGAGVKSLYYYKARQDSVTNAELPRNDNQFFIVLGGSGSL